MPPGCRCHDAFPLTSACQRRLRMTQGTQHSADDPRNADILIWVNGALKPRDQAVVSVFDSGFVLGDGVWEGFRVVGGQPLFLEAHLDRLYEGAKALMLDIGLDRVQLTRAIRDLSLIHISEPTRLLSISYAVFCLKKK